MALYVFTPASYVYMNSIISSHKMLETTAKACNCYLVVNDNHTSTHTAMMIILTTEVQMVILTDLITGDYLYNSLWCYILKL